MGGPVCTNFTTSRRIASNGENEWMGGTVRRLWGMTAVPKCWGEQRSKSGTAVVLKAERRAHTYIHLVRKKGGFDNKDNHVYEKSPEDFDWALVRTEKLRSKVPNIPSTCWYHYHRAGIHLLQTRRTVPEPKPLPGTLLKCSTKASFCKTMRILKLAFVNKKTLSRLPDMGEQDLHKRILRASTSQKPFRHPERVRSSTTRIFPFNFLHGRLESNCSNTWA